MSGGKVVAWPLRRKDGSLDFDSAAEQPTTADQNEAMYNGESFVGVVLQSDLAAALARAEAAERDALAKQARIDALMMEYCPDEITGEQLENWMAAQRPIPEPLTMSIPAAGEAQ